LLCTTPAAGAEGRAFKDARDRFKLSLPPGWELTPQPGDTEGMVFRRKSGNVPGILAVRVGPTTASDTLTSVMNVRGRPFERELGYDRLSEAEGRVGADLRALRRVHTVFLNGDSQIKRYGVDHVVFAYGHAHFIHFETAEGHYPTFARDVEAILRSYQPLAGRKVYAPVLGRWRMAGGDGTELTLADDQFFTLGKRVGVYRVDGVRLTFQEQLGQETFRYSVAEEALSLQNDNLGQPMVFRRAADAPGGADDPDDEETKAKARRALKVTDQLLVGVWAVVQGGDAHEMAFSESGAFRFGPMSGRFRLKGNLLTVESSTGTAVTYHVGYDGKRIRLSGGDLDQPLVLERRD
jgi:hypothetical protein